MPAAAAPACASTGCSPGPAWPRAGRRSAGSPRAACRSTAACWPSRASSSRRARTSASTASRCRRSRRRGSGASTSRPALVTTAADPEAGPTVFDQLPEEMPRVVSIGRLDINSEGLLLLDQRRCPGAPSGAAGHRAGPGGYRVRAHGAVDEKALEALAERRRRGRRAGYGPIEAALGTGSRAPNAWLTGRAACARGPGKPGSAAGDGASRGLTVTRADPRLLLTVPFHGRATCRGWGRWTRVPRRGWLRETRFRATSRRRRRP